MLLLILNLLFLKKQKFSSSSYFSLTSTSSNIHFYFLPIQLLRFSSCHKDVTLFNLLHFIYLLTVELSKREVKRKKKKILLDEFNETTAAAAASNVTRHIHTLQSEYCVTFNSLYKVQVTRKKNGRRKDHKDHFYICYCLFFLTCCCCCLPGRYTWVRKEEEKKENLSCWLLFAPWWQSHMHDSNDLFFFFFSFLPVKIELCKWLYTQKKGTSCSNISTSKSNRTSQ